MHLKKPKHLKRKSYFSHPNQLQFIAKPKQLPANGNAYEHNSKIYILHGIKFAIESR